MDKSTRSRKSGMLQRSVGQLLELCLDCSCSTWKTLKKPSIYFLSCIFMFFPRPWVFLKKMSGWLADEGLSNEDLEVILHAARAQEPVFMRDMGH